MRFLLAFFLIFITPSSVLAGYTWVNNITVHEYNMTWSYTERISGTHAIAYRVSLDKNNDSFVSAWEVLKADREIRKKFRKSLEEELDVRVNNKTTGVEVEEIYADLSTDTVGKTHLNDTIVNKYKVTYRFKESILNATSIWFLGQAGTPVTITMPQGVDVVNITGINNVTVINHTITGFFAEKSKERGEITLTLKRNTSFHPPPTPNITSSEPTPKTGDVNAFFVLIMILLISRRTSSK